MAKYSFNIFWLNLFSLFIYAILSVCLCVCTHRLYYICNKISGQGMFIFIGCFFLHSYALLIIIIFIHKNWYNFSLFTITKIIMYIMYIMHTITMYIIVKFLLFLLPCALLMLGLLENRVTFLMKIKCSAFLFQIIFLKKRTT